jgi:hypothetical protein
MKKIWIYAALAVVSLVVAHFVGLFPPSYGNSGPSASLNFVLSLHLCFAYLLAGAIGKKFPVYRGRRNISKLAADSICSVWASSVLLATSLNGELWFYQLALLLNLVSVVSALVFIILLVRAVASRKLDATNPLSEGSEDR